MKRLALPFLAFIAALVVGCSSLGLQAPVTPEDNLRYAEATLTGVYTTLSSSVTSGAMTGAQARSIKNKVDPLKATFTTADALCLQNGCTLPTTVQQQITDALVILTAVANQLRATLPASQTASLPKAR